jgi:hypothetical protein
MGILPFDVVLECLNTIDIDILEVVDTDIKRHAERFAEMPFQRLWFDFYLEKLLLLIAGSAIGRIPVTVIILLEPRITRDTPVGKFMQGGAFIITGKLYFRRCCSCGCLVKRFRKTANKPGLQGGHNFTVEMLYPVNHARLMKLLY